MKLKKKDHPAKLMIHQVLLMKDKRIFVTVDGYEIWNIYFCVVTKIWLHFFDKQKPNPKTSVPRTLVLSHFRLKLRQHLSKWAVQLFL